MIDIPVNKSDIECYLRRRYRLDDLKDCRNIPLIDKQALLIEQAILEFEEQLDVPQQRLDRLYFNWRPVEAGHRAITNTIHARCESCRHYYTNIPKQRALAKWATRMCIEKEGLPKEVVVLLKSRAKPCPQGLWDVFVVNQKKEGYEWIVGNRFIGPEICPDFQETKK